MNRRIGALPGTRNTKPVIEPDEIIDPYAATREPPGGTLVSVIDTAQRLQAPAVHKYVRALRTDHPHDTPSDLIKRLEDRYLLLVTGSGGAVGATAAVPGVGTIAAIGAMGAETVFFLEASALLVLATAEVHGIPIAHREQRRALVLTVALGDAGLGALRGAVGSKTATLTSLQRSPLGSASLSGLNKRLLKTFMKRFAAKRAPLMVGKILPAGIGAAVGAGGNRLLGKAMIANSRKAFGPPPSAWPTIIESGGATEIRPATRAKKR